MNLTPKDDTVPTYKRIERDHESNDYNGYVPKADDVWCFHDGQRWTVSGTDLLIAGPGADFVLSPFLLPVRSLTSHIERPVRTVTVPKNGYMPRVGDRLCGPDGPALRVSAAGPNGVTMADIRPSGWTLWDSTGSFTCLVALCTRIERDES